MRKYILLAALAAAIIGGWMYISPWISLDRLRDSAREADHAELSEKIDFPAVRASVKSHMREEIEREAQKGGLKGKLAAIGSDLGAGGFVDRVVDEVITPDGVASLLVTGSLVPRRDGAKPKEIDWEVDREGLMRFRAYPKGEAGKTYPALIFTRHGIGWRLVGIDLPERKPDA